jgi:hypothetical protein
MNRFKERYRTGGHRKVRSREVPSLVVENLVLKKKRECEGEEEGTPMRGYRYNGGKMAGLIIHVGCHPH